MRRTIATTVLGALCLVSTPGGAQSQPSNALVDAVVRCKGEANEQARLRCYDTAVATLAQATASGEIIVVDKEDVRKTRRSLFGFSLPNLPFFGRDESQKEEQPEEIEAKIQSVRGLGYGKFLIELDTGARWQTTEGGALAREPKAGEMVKIKKGVMGSYFLAVEGRRGIKALRVG